MIAILQRVYLAIILPCEKRDWDLENERPEEDALLESSEDEELDEDRGSDGGFRTPPLALDTPAGDAQGTNGDRRTVSMAMRSGLGADSDSR